MTERCVEQKALLAAELTQRREEGDEISALEALMGGLEDCVPEEIDRLFQQVFDLWPPSVFSQHEPSELVAIRALRPDGPRRLVLPDETTLADKLLGAWLGRAAGCQLGKPVEGLTRAQIEAYLRAAGAFPLVDYVPLLESPPPGIRIVAPQSTRGNFDRMARDDDMDYTILGLHLLETHGPAFTTRHVAEAWLHLLPYQMVYTAERAAYRNLVNGLPMEQVPLYANPYREWIGAQIRADGWAYGAAAWPERAAEFAWRDACLSHIKNGIYGEMWAAAMIAAAFGSESAPTPQAIRRVIEIGLSEIPPESRLAVALHDVLAWRQETDDWQEAWERINADYGHYHWVHTINNALVVALGLLYGNGDFARSIGIAVMAGWDTDCNGATVGSVLGALSGAQALPAHWIAPLNDRVESALVGFNDSRFSDLARRSLAVCRAVHAAG